MNKILIIGKKSFLGSNLKKYLSKNLQLDNFSFEEIVKKKIPILLIILLLLTHQFIQIT